MHISNLFQLGALPSFLIQTVRQRMCMYSQPRPQFMRRQMPDIPLCTAPSILLVSNVTLVLAALSR